MYHNNIVTNKDGQIQTLRDQTQHLSGSESREEWFRSTEKLAAQKAEAMKLQITGEARMQLSDVENKARLEIDRLRSHANREETEASNLLSEAGLYRNSKEAELIKKNVKWVESMAQYSIKAQKAEPIAQTRGEELEPCVALVTDSETTGTRYRMNLTN